MNDIRTKVPFFNKIILLTFGIIIISIVATTLLSYYITINALQVSHGSLNGVEKKFFVYFVILLLTMLTIAFFVLRKSLMRVLEPIGQLTSGFHELSKGNFNIRLEVNDYSQLAVLCDQFNHVALQLSTLEEKILTSQKIEATLEPPTMNGLDDVVNEIEQIIDKAVVIRELQKAEKMNAIGQLAASVAHEIRNPMTVVKGFLQVFLAKEHMSEEERMYIHLMIDEMNRAEMIINDYLSLAKPSLELIEGINGKELAEKAKELINSYARLSKNMIISTPILENITIKGNKGELQQVLINILKNGVEALKDGGEIKLSLYKEDGYGVFEVSDTGIGMTKEELERIGTAFYSLKEKGTGIGLTVCYHIINRMKGKIEVESEKGVGTTFKVFVPLWE